MALVEANIGTSGAVADREITRSASIRVKNVLFATDFSTTSEAAMPYAAAICRRFGSTLHIVHVLSETNLLMISGGVDYVSMGTLYEDAHAQAKDKLGQLAQCFEGIPHKTHVGSGQIWNSLARVIEANEIDLIVVGTHGRGGLGKLLLGSVAEDILRHAPCPVLTVGPKVSGRAKLPALQKLGRDLAPVELELQQILFATSLGNDAAQLAKHAVALAEEFHARFTIMHVLEDYAQLGRRPGPIDDSMNQLQTLVPKDAALQYAADIVIEFGSAPERILKVASERQAEMIVLGARSADVGATHLPWSAAHHVIAQAHCPVLTIRG